MTTPTKYWEFAYEAIKLGLITKAEADAIVRAGTRKQNYWDRHMRDIKALVKERLERHRVKGD